MGYPVKFSGFLWDYRKDYVLDYMAFFLVSELHTYYAKIASAADFRSPCSSDQRRSSRLLMRPTPHMRALHALSLRQANTDTTDRAIFTIAALFSHTGKHQTGTRTHRHTARQLCRWTPPPTSGFVFSTLQSFQRCTLFSKVYLKLRAFRLVT